MADNIPLRIEQIYTYPIKSLRGISLSEAEATDTGFAYDRQFMLWDVEKSENLHIGLRPALCLFTTEFLPDTNPQHHKRPCVQVKYGLSHTFDKPSVLVEPVSLPVPLKPDVGTLSQVAVTMHLSPCSAYDMGEKYNQWFSQRLGYSVKLLYIGHYRRKVLGNMGHGVAAGPSSRRQSYTMAVSAILLILLLTIWSGYNFPRGNGASPVQVFLLMMPWLISCLVFAQYLKGWPSKSSPVITFADLAAYLIVSKTSYEEANSRLPDNEELDITKFRANIVVSGATKAYDEDFWAELRIRNDVVLTITQNCARCNSINVDYATGKTGKTEAGTILKRLSKDRRVDSGTKWSPIFGRYGFLTSPPGVAQGVRIRVGDKVEVTRRNPERTVTGKLM